MNQSTASRFLIYAMMSLLLAACGGGGGGGGPLVGGSTTPPQPRITLTLSDENQNAITEINGNDVGIVRAVVRTADNKIPASPVKVTFTTTQGEFNVADGTELTNSDGVATITLYGGTERATGTVSASATVEEVSVRSNSIDFRTDGLRTTGETEQYSLALALSHKSISMANPATATLTVTDKAGNPFPDGVIKFSATLGLVSPNDGVVLTDANGQATVNLSSNGTSGSGSISATLEAGDQTFNSAIISYITVNSPTLTLQLIDQETGLPVSNVSSDQVVDVIATLADSSGSALAGEIIEFSSDKGQLSVSSALTVTDGVAKVTLTAGNVPGGGTVQASTTIGDNSLSSSVNFETDGQQDQPFSANIQMLLVPSTISSNSPGTATITVTDQDSVPVEGAIVEFSTTLGALDPSSGSVTTDAAGSAAIELSAINNQTGKGRLSATVTIEGQELDAEPIDFIISNLKMTVTLSKPVINGNELFTATANLTDVDGSPLENIAVEFDTTIGVFDDSTSNSDLTDANGNAQVTLRGGASVGEGIVTATASVNGVGISKTAAFQNTAVQPQLSVSLSSEALVEGETATLTATLLDYNGIAVPDQLVDFSTTLGDLDRSSAITNGTGKASVVLTADAATGIGSVSATTTINNIALNASMYFESGSAIISLPDIQITPISGVLDGNEVILITARLWQDETHTAVLPNVSVIFTSSLGQFVDDDNSAITDGSGYATVTLRGDGNPGEGVLTAVAAYGGITVSDNTTFQSSNLKPYITITAIDNIDENETVAVVATLRNYNGVVIADQIVNFQATLGNLQKSSDITNTSGQASANLVGTAAAGAGSATATAVVNGISVSDVENYTSGGGAGAGDIPQVTILPITGVLDGNEVITIQATVKDSTGLLQPNINVIFSSTLGEFVDGDNSDASGPSGAGLGVAGVQLRGKGVAGEGVVTAVASVGGVSVSDTTTFQASNKKPTITVQVIDNSGAVVNTIGANQVVTVRASILNYDGGALGTADKGQQVTFNAGGLGTLSATVAVSDAFLDRATVTLTSNTTSAVGNVSASMTINGIAVTGSTSITNSGTNAGAPPDQNSFTMTRIKGGSQFATSDHVVAIEGDEYIDTMDIKVSLSNFFNNLVPDGTRVEFTTELGTIEPSCTTTNGECTVTFQSTEPKAPLNSAVSFRNLDDDSCPTNRIIREPVTPAADRSSPLDGLFDGNTRYRVGGIDLIQNAVTHAALLPTTDYLADELGFRCQSGACSGVALMVTYRRAWLDEDNSGDTTHFITHPGEASAPSVAFTGVPCRAAKRTASTSAPAYNGGLGQPYGGRTTILAWAVGEESFIDKNGNDQYDAGETFFDLTEAFLDKNEDGVYDHVNADIAAGTAVAPYKDDPLETGTNATGATRDKGNPYCYGPKTQDPDSSEQSTFCFQKGGEEEVFVDMDGDGVFDAANGIYNGSRCLNTGQGCTTDLVHIRKEVQVYMSGSVPQVIARSNGERIVAVDVSGALAREFQSDIRIIPNSRPAAAFPVANFDIGYSVDAVTVYPGVSERFEDAATNGDLSVDTLPNLTTSNTLIYLDISDKYNGFLPRGTTIKVSSDNRAGCLMSSVGGKAFDTIALAATPAEHNETLTIPDSSGTLFTQVPIVLIGAGLGGPGNIQITVTVPSNVAYSYSLPCTE